MHSSSRRKISASQSHFVIRYDKMISTTYITVMSDEKKKSLKKRKELKMTGLCSVMKKRASIGHGMMEDGSRKTNCLEDGLQ